MRWWGRGNPDRAGRGPGEAVDPVFGYLTAAQGERLRILTQRAFAEAGVEVVPCGDHLRADNGRQFGLSNLAAWCHAAGSEKAWPDLAMRHVQGVLAAGEEASRIDGLDRDDALRRIFVRLMGTAEFEDSRQWFGYAREWGGGDLLELLVVNFPESLLVLPDEQVERLGLEDMRAAGLHNLRHEPVDSHEILNEPHGVRLHIALGESPYVASKLLVLPDLLDQFLGDREYPHGLLVATPFRHQLAFWPIEKRQVLSATLSMAGLAAHGFDRGVGAVSPCVYWWRDGHLTRVTFPDGEGKIGIDGTGDFGDLLDQLDG